MDGVWLGGRLVIRYMTQVVHVDSDPANAPTIGIVVQPSSVERAEGRRRYGTDLDEYSMALVEWSPNYRRWEYPAHLYAVRALVRP